MKKIIGLILVLIFGYAGVFFFSHQLEQTQFTENKNFGDEDLYLSPQQLNLIGSDFKGLLADWYWIRSLQYIGDKIIHQQEATGSNININDLSPLNARLVYPMLDSAATLDPQFMTVYSYGASVLPAINSEHAIKLLEKGVAANPDEWRLYHNLGYIYWQNKDYGKAAALYAEGATKKDAPVWMKQMSVSMQAQGGSKEFALQIYKQMFETAEDDQTKSFAELRYNQAVSEIQLEIINHSLQSFKEKSGRCANSFKEILPLLSNQVRADKINLQLDTASNPVDPTGIPYLFSTEACMAKLNPESKIPQF